MRPLSPRPLVLLPPAELTDCPPRRADNPLDMECRNKDDFTALSTSLSDLLIQKHSSSKHFAAFVDELTKALAQPLKSDEVGKVRASMASLAIDKGKAEKTAASGKGLGGKAPVRMVARGKEDLSSFGEVLDDEAAAANFDPDEDFVRPSSSLSHALSLFSLQCSLADCLPSCRCRCALRALPGKAVL